MPGLSTVAGADVPAWCAAVSNSLTPSRPRYKPCFPQSWVSTRARARLSRWLHPLFELLRDEADGRQPGAAALFTKLADVFLAQTLRTYLVGAQDAGLLRLATLPDPTIAEAVHLLRSRPEHPWTVADLAHTVGVSRTLFTARFRELVGEPPIRYLTKVRLSLVAGYLATTTQNLSAIARRTGYDSEASLSKAFKREYGTSPGDYRRRRASQPIAIAGDERDADPGDHGARLSTLHTAAARPVGRDNGGRRRPVATR